MNVLYKYIPGERVLSSIPEIGDGTLRATPPIALNDPFECAVLISGANSDKEQENARLAKELTAINEYKPVLPHAVEEAREKHGSLFARQLTVEQLSTCFGFVSFASSPTNVLMWSHYSANGAGFVLGYDIHDLHILANDLGSLREVMYHDTPPKITGPSAITDAPFDVFLFMSIKSTDWAYENEWRLIVDLHKTTGTGQADDNGAPINLIQVPNEALVTVHYTERTPRCLVEQVRERLSEPNNRFGTSTLTKLVLSPDSYRYEEAPAQRHE